MSTKHTPIKELERMSQKELRRDLLIKRAEIAKLRMNLEMQSEKNHALHKHGKKEVARMTMVLKQMERNGTGKTEAVEALESISVEKPKKKASQSAKKPVQQSGSQKKKAKKS